MSKNRIRSYVRSFVRSLGTNDGEIYSSVEWSILLDTRVSHALIARARNAIDFWHAISTMLSITHRVSFIFATR